MFCSPGVSEQEAAQLSEFMGIPMTKKLGKYLGHLILQSGNNKDAHKE